MNKAGCEWRSARIMTSARDGIRLNGSVIPYYWRHAGAYSGETYRLANWQAWQQYKLLYEHRAQYGRRAAWKAAEIFVVDLSSTSSSGSNDVGMANGDEAREFNR